MGSHLLNDLDTLRSLWFCVFRTSRTKRKLHDKKTALSLSFYFPRNIIYDQGESEVRMLVHEIDDDVFVCENPTFLMISADGIIPKTLLWGSCE